MIRRALVITCVSVSLVAASFASAQAATVSPDTWAPKFCTALQTWSTTIADEAASLEATMAGKRDDLVAARDNVVSFLGTSIAATKAALSALKQAGDPSSTNGDKIAAKFVAGLTAVSKEFTKAKAKASGISTTNTSKFKATGAEIQRDLDNADRRVSASFDSVEGLDTGKKLEKAIKAAPECAFLS